MQIICIRKEDLILLYADKGQSAIKKTMQNIVVVAAISNEYNFGIK